jgi:hypothetical protein
MKRGASTDGIHQQKGTVLTTRRLHLRPLRATFRQINDYGHTEDIKKNRGLHHPLAELTARDCYASGCCSNGCSRALK